MSTRTPVLIFDNDILETGIWRVGCNPKVLAAPQLPAALNDTQGTILLVHSWLLWAIASSSLVADAALSDPEQTQSDFFCFFFPSP